MNLLMFFGVKLFGVSSFMWIFIGAMVIGIVLGVMGLIAVQDAEGLIQVGTYVIVSIIFLILHAPILPILITLLVLSVISLIFFIYLALEEYGGIYNIILPLDVICNIIGLILFCTNGLI